MIAFSPNNLSPTAQARLDALQAEVDAATAISREQGYKKAADLWEKRKNRQADKPIWAEIEGKLADGHPRKGLCQYCEFDRHAPTEHVFSKKHSIMLLLILKVQELPYRKSINSLIILVIKLPSL